VIFRQSEAVPIRVVDTKSWSKYLKEMIERINILWILILLSGSCKLLVDEPTFTPVNISNRGYEAEDPDIVVDKEGTLHVIWSEYHSDGELIFYTMKPLGGEWTEPESLTPKTRGARNPKLAVDNNGNLHAIWQQSVPQYHWVLIHRMRLQNGEWSAPDTLFGYGNSVIPSIIVDNENTIHVIWFEWPQLYNGDLFYSFREQSGRWHIPIRLTNTPGDENHYGFVIDDQSNLHIIAGPNTINVEDVPLFHFIGRKFTWRCDTIAIVLYPNPITLTKDIYGNLHLFVQTSHMYFEGDTFPAEGTYWLMKPEGENIWTKPQMVTGGVELKAVADSMGNVYIFVNTWGSSLCYRKRTPDGKWTKPCRIGRIYSGMSAAYNYMDNSLNVVFIDIPDDLGVEQLYYVHIPNP